METQKNEFYKEIKTDRFLSHAPDSELKSIINYQNQRIADLQYKLTHVENLLERIFRLNILKTSKLKLDVCTYMSAKTGVKNGRKKTEDDKETIQ